MAKARSPNRDKAFQIWQWSGGKISNRDIAKQLDISEKTVSGWKAKDKWNGVLHKNERSTPNDFTEYSDKNIKRKPGGQPGNGNAKGHGAPKGNQNAVGNCGGAPARNTNAVTTGEYRTVWVDYLDEEERAFYDSVDTSAESQIDHAIRILAMKERWAIQTIHDLRSGLNEKEKKVLAARKEKGEIVKVYDETGEYKLQYRDQPELIITEITETEFRKIDDILKQEEILLKIQNAKTKQIALLHKIDIDNRRLALEQEKSRVDVAAKRLDLEASSMPDLTAEAQINFYIPSNGRDTNGD